MLSLQMTQDNRKQPLYLRLYQQLREQIERGELPSGSKLPSKRVMAGSLGVSVNTVCGAYGQLQSEGYIESRPKSGYYVCGIELLQTAAKTPLPGRVLQRPAQKYDIDFHPGRIAEERFPVTVWTKLLRSAMDDPNLLRRAPAQGDLGLRSEVVGYLRSARGVDCRPEQVILGTGTDSLLAMLSFILDNECSLTVENPVYNRPYEIFSRMGHPVHFAPIDKQGIMLEHLEPLEQTLVYTTPSHQYPLGYSMPMSRRTRLLNWSGRGRFRYIIEDDYDSEFRYKLRPIPSLQSIDKNGRVIYMGTFSRVIAPSLRIAYMVLPETLLVRYQERYSHFSSGVSALEQIVLREFIRQGYFQRHLNRMRVLYGQKREILENALADIRDRVQIIGEAAGTQATLKVRNGMTEQELIDAAAAHGVGVYPISPYFVGGMPRQFQGKILLGFGALSEEKITEGVERLKEAWNISYA